MHLEMISRQPANSIKATPLLFVHGAFTGAAVWDVYFLPYFARHGYPAYAFSLRGHGASAGHTNLPWHSLADYVDDLSQAIAMLDCPPILIGHSMGGMVIQKYLETNSVLGTVLMASTPPHGLLSSLVGMGVSNPLLLCQLALLQQFGTHFAHPSVIRQALFSEHTSEADIQDYYPLLNGESQRVSLDMLGLNPLRRWKKPDMPLLVMGAEQDAFFSPGVVRDTAHAYGVKAVTFPEMGHAMMLERDWQKVADVILGWLDANITA
ncbi:MAG: alpha/beta hydrolase [Candidatus Competibacteraceae bacterium]|nr:alpha/beta hydrolase [Candidatus Competibacteraceae bacterium]